VGFGAREVESPSQWALWAPRVVSDTDAESGVQARRGRVVRTGHYAGSVVLCEGRVHGWFECCFGIYKKIAMIGHGDSFQKEAQLPVSSRSARRGEPEGEHLGRHVLQSQVGAVATATRTSCSVGLKRRSRASLTSSTELLVWWANL
jgi:hypothetical protein